MGKSNRKESACVTYFKSKNSIEKNQKRLLSLIKKSNSLPENSTEHQAVEQQIHETKVALRRDRITFHNARQKIRSGIAAGLVFGSISIGTIGFALNHLNHEFKEAESGNHEVLYTPNEITERALWHLKEIISQETGVPPEHIYAPYKSNYNEYLGEQITDININVRKTDADGNLLPEETIYTYHEAFNGSDHFLGEDNNMPEYYKDTIRVISEAQTTESIKDAKEAYVAVYELGKKMSKNATQNTLDESDTYSTQYGDETYSVQYGEDDDQR